MRTLQVAISDMEYGMFGIPSEKLNFSNFIDIVSKQLMRQNLNKTVSLAEKYNLSTMTMEEITNEVKLNAATKKIKYQKERSSLDNELNNYLVDLSNFTFDRDEANNYE
ncbi:MAG: hypothetical protein FWC39_11635 [Bacteroidetes bacterium]|nr:hypothetical protein [Bacteroidota bacterium]